MKRLMIVLVLALLAAGCRTVLHVDNRSDPQSFDPIVLVTGQTFYYKEIFVDVPNEVRNKDFEATRVDIFADVWAQYLDGPIDADLYIGLDPGQANLDDPTRNELVATARISQVNEHDPLVIKSPHLALVAIQRETFYLKTVVRSSGPTIGVLHVDNVYLDIVLERESNGLFPFFYFF